MHDQTLVVEITVAIATTAAVVVALFNAHRALRLQQRGFRVEGRRQAGLEIARWLQGAESTILAWHNPENWRIPPEMKFGRRSKVKPGDLMPPSQGRMGPRIQSVIAEFDSIRGLARLAFGPDHEVSALVGGVISAINQVAERGVISTAEKPTPRDYVDNTFLPLSADLFEALADACGFRAHGERVQRSGIKSSDNLPVRR
jgi:hypothetical protein